MIFPSAIAYAPFVCHLRYHNARYSINAMVIVAVETLTHLVPRVRRLAIPSLFFRSITCFNMSLLITFNKLNSPSPKAAYTLRSASPNRVILEGSESSFSSLSMNSYSWYVETEWVMIMNVIAVFSGFLARSTSRRISAGRIKRPVSAR